MKFKPCPYCTIPEIKERTITENKLAWSFPTNIPVVPGHVIITTKRCIPTFDDMTAKEQAAVFALFKEIKPALRKAFGAKGFNMAWNEGELAGQTVPHFHLQVLPRKKGDTGVVGYEPRKYLYLPKPKRPISPEEDLKRVVRLIKNKL